MLRKGRFSCSCYRCCCRAVVDSLIRCPVLLESLCPAHSALGRSGEEGTRRYHFVFNCCAFLRIRLCLQGSLHRLSTASSSKRYACRLTPRSCCRTITSCSLSPPPSFDSFREFQFAATTVWFPRLNRHTCTTDPANEVSNY